MKKSVTVLFFLFYNYSVILSKCFASVNCQLPDSIKGRPTGMILDEITVDRVSKIDKDSIYDVVEKNASFQGGKSELNLWIEKNKRCPKTNTSDSKPAKVYCSFVVERTGKVSEIRVVRSPGSVYTAEAIRLLKAMPRWDPATIDNVKVRSRISFIINF